MIRAACFILSIAAAAAQSTPVGMFDGHSGVGENPRTGSVELDASKPIYRVTGGGANVWAAADAFHFAWRKMSGDVNITADIRFDGAGVNAHRKAMLMVRQDLTAGSPYADVALHGDGLTSLQYREAAAGLTKEARSTLTAPVRIRLERRGNQFTLFAGARGEELKPAGPVTVAMTDPVYVGIGVCSHDASVLETVEFSNVHIARPPQRYRSHITVYDLKTKKTNVVYTADELFEAPNWSFDGQSMLVNSRNNIYRLALSGGEPVKIDFGPGYRFNNDHDFSPDGKLIALSASIGTGRSAVFVANVDGSGIKRLTAKTPSYFHGWSRDGKWLAFVGERDGNFDLYRVSVDGGDEQRLTESKGFDDGPDYSPDRKWIYFNSDRSGGWDIWRIPVDGAGPNDAKAERVTSDAEEDWFPHPSPDGKWMVFLSFPPKTEGHNGRLDIQLRLARLPKKKAAVTKIDPAVKLFGGQGTINVNSWSPDSSKFAFVSYELLSPTR